MTDIAPRDLQTTIQAWDQSVWSLAALAVAARDDAPPELTAAARDLLAAAGLTGAPGEPLPEPGTAAPDQVASQAAAALRQACALASGVYQWGADSDQALLAQGHAGAPAAAGGMSPAPQRRADLGAANAHPGRGAGHHDRPETGMTTTPSPRPASHPRPGHHVQPSHRAPRPRYPRPL